MAGTQVQRHAQGTQLQKNRLRSGSQQTRPPQEARPITQPQSVGVRGSYQCIVDYDHQPFSVTWSCSPEYPDLASFPVLQNANAYSLHQTPEMAAVWRGSAMIDYGSHASIRFIEHSQIPIPKLAHPRSAVYGSPAQHEFDILAELTKLGLPVVRLDQQPILDNGVTCGYRMKKLFKVELSELRSRTDDIKRTLDRLHSGGFSHGDFSPSNIMKDGDGHIILIDFSFAGRLESSVPSFFPS